MEVCSIVVIVERVSYGRCEMKHHKICTGWKGVANSIGYSIIAVFIVSPLRGSCSMKFVLLKVWLQSVMYLRIQESHILYDTSDTCSSIIEVKSHRRLFAAWGLTESGFPLGGNG
jgi:hypothetical protein